MERGFAASTREIARRAGVSEGVLFQRYATKADLFCAAMALPALDLKDLLRTRHVTGWQDLEAVATAMLAHFRASLPVLLAIASSPDFRFEEFARTDLRLRPERGGRACDAGGSPARISTCGCRSWSPTSKSPSSICS